MKYGYKQTIEKFGLIAPDVDNYTSLKSEEKTRWIDRDGYQYYLSRHNLESTYRKNGKLSKFFNGNIFTEENVRLYASIVSNGDISVVSFNAQNAHDKIIFKSERYAYEYAKSFNEFTHRPYVEKLRYDFAHKNKYTLEEIKNMALNRFNITVVSNQYINNETPIEYYCNKPDHAHVVQTMPWAQMISRKTPCRMCSKSQYYKNLRLKGKEKFEAKLASSNLVNPNIEVVGNYKSCHIKIKCKCKKCERFIYLRPDHILSGIGCGKCIKSLGEKLIEKYLAENNIDYIPQYIFKDCKIKKKAMPFDFYLPNLNVAIEFDGAQHFMPIDAFGGVDGFRNLKARDEFKSNYCKTHNIQLIRIPYTQINNIASILGSCQLLCS